VVSDELIKCIPNQGVVLIGGGIGSGKSCLAYGIAESAHRIDDQRKMYTYNFPNEKRGLLPDYIVPIYDEEFPENSLVIADEAYFSFYAKDHNSDANKFMDKFSGLARQKGILTIFITQTLRKLSLATVSGVQTLLIKCPDIMMVKLDRSELRSVLAEALARFRELTPLQRIASTYVVSMEKEGLIRDSNALPGFWNDELSRAWQGIDLKDNFKANGMDLLDEVDSIYRELNTVLADNMREKPDLYKELRPLIEDVFNFLDEGSAEKALDCLRERLPTALKSVSGGVVKGLLGRVEFLSRRADK